MIIVYCVEQTTVIQDLFITQDGKDLREIKDNMHNIIHINGIFDIDWQIYHNFSDDQNRKIETYTTITLNENDFTIAIYPKEKQAQRSDGRQFLNCIMTFDYFGISRIDRAGYNNGNRDWDPLDGQLRCSSRSQSEIDEPRFFFNIQEKKIYIFTSKMYNNILEKLKNININININDQTSEYYWYMNVLNIQKNSHLNEKTENIQALFQLIKQDYDNFYEQVQNDVKTQIDEYCQKQSQIVLNNLQNSDFSILFKQPDLNIKQDLSFQINHNFIDNDIKEIIQSISEKDKSFNQYKTRLNQNNDLDIKKQLNVYLNKSINDYEKWKTYGVKNYYEERKEQQIKIIQEQLYNIVKQKQDEYNRQQDKLKSQSDKKRNIIIGSVFALAIGVVIFGLIKFGQSSNKGKEFLPETNMNE